MTTDVVRVGDTDTDLMSDIMMLLMVVMMASVLGAITTQAAQTQALAYEGRSDPRRAHVTKTLGWLDLVNQPPYTPWIGAYFINDGPSSVRVGINYPTNMLPINPGETITIDRSGAQERISAIYYICDIGLTAELRITGEY